MVLILGQNGKGSAEVEAEVASKNVKPVHPVSMNEVLRRQMALIGAAANAAIGSIAIELTFVSNDDVTGKRQNDSNV